MSVRADKMSAADTVTPAFDADAVRRDFPILSTEVNGHTLVYLDNAATSQKPRATIDAVSRYYMTQNANIHRGVHYLSEQATLAYEAAREKVRAFINAPSSREIIFLRGATEAINLVAQTYGYENIKAGDEILLSEMEHHSNIVPWQLLCERTGAILKVIPITDSGEIDLDAFERLLGPRTRLLALVHVSNALGTINPVKSMIGKAHALDIPVLLDGAQAAPHMPVDVQDLNCDFYALSGHKMYGPTGIGALYVRESLLQKMPPWQGGGDMIRVVRFDETMYNDLPWRFEAGTPNIAGAVGLGATIDYLGMLGMEHIVAHEKQLLSYAEQQLRQIEGLRIIGTATAKAGVVSFVIDGIHPHDIGTIVNDSGVAIRTGHHCAMPVMDRFNVPATARASFGLYNTFADTDRLVTALKKAHEVFG